MGYTDEDIEFANLILTDRGNLDDAKVEVWMKDPEHVMLLKEFATVYQKRMNIDFNRDKKEEFARLENTIQERKSRRMTLRWSVAASVILFIGLFVGRMVNEWRNLDEMRMLAETERIVPGVKAELILSTGERVVLNQQCVSIEGVNETGIQNDSVTGLNYTTAKVQGEGMIYNTMRIPVGGFYQLALSDGSKVWLNSMTEFRFPVAFTGEERKVYLTGEAYFQVAKDTNKPFRVVVNDMMVEALGTGFNINAYQDDNCLRTTLVEGKVRVSYSDTRQECILVPGEQAVLKEGVLTSGQVNVDDIIAWKKGRFVFSDMPLEIIANQLERWYDVEIRFDDTVAKYYRFTGVMKRYNELEQVLGLIEETTNVRFKVEGRQVKVFRNL